MTRIVLKSNREISADAALMAELAREYSDLDALCLCLEGNAHNVLALLNDPLPFHLLPAEPNGMLIPWDMMAEHLAQILAFNLTVAEQLVAAMPAERLFVLNAPPPGADEAHILAHPGHFKDRLDLGVSPDALRRHIYTLQSTVYRDHARALGAVFVPAPSPCYDARGMLAREYWREDPTHGNAAYGHLVLDALRRALAVPL